MKITIESIMDYIKKTEKLTNSSSYYGNKMIVKSFLKNLRDFIKILSKIHSLVIQDKYISELTFNSDNYKEILESITDRPILNNKLEKKLFNLPRLEKIKKALLINTFEIQIDYSKAVDLRLGLILIIFNCYLLSYQINNKTIRFCNQEFLIKLVDVLDKYLSSNSIFPLSISDKLVKSFTDSIEFKALLIHNKNILNKKEI